MMDAKCGLIYSGFINDSMVSAWPRDQSTTLADLYAYQINKHVFQCCMRSETIGNCNYVSKL